MSIEDLILNLCTNPVGLGSCSKALVALHSGLPEGPDGIVANEVSYPGYKRVRPSQDHILRGEGIYAEFPPSEQPDPVTVKYFSVVDFIEGQDRVLFTGKLKPQPLIRLGDSLVVTANF